jgi:predicted dehydrogenase
VVLVTSRPGEGRERALAGVLGEGTELLVVRPGDALPPLGGAGGIVVDGPQPPRPAAELADLRAYVEAGGRLVAVGAAPGEGGADGFWADLLGVTAGPPLPVGEWYAKIRAGGGFLTSRLTPEFAVVDRFQPLRPLRPGRVVADVSVAFTDLPALVESPLGAGLVLASGLGIGDGALATTELAAVLRRALRRRDARMPDRELGVGVVGYGAYGGMGYAHGVAARATAGLEFVATCDSSPERRKAAEQDFVGVRAYANVDELAADGDVEVVIVATPPSSHAALALQLLRAGKHVACEKPMCLTVAEADELVAIARAHDRVLTANQNRRWDTDFVALRRAVDAGLLGKVFNVETFVGGFEHPCRAWHSEVSVSGGAVYDWGSHHVDWILLLMADAPATVSCHGHKRVWHDVTNLDQLRLRLSWADGREAEFLQSDVAAVRRPKFYVQGTAGTLVGLYRPLTFERIEPGRGYVAEPAHHAEAPAELSLARYESGYGITTTALPPAPEQRFAFHRNLADHLHLGEPLAVTAESVRQVIAVLEAGQRSALAGGAVQPLPPPLPPPERSGAA